MELHDMTLTTANTTNAAAAAGLLSRLFLRNRSHSADGIAGYPRTPEHNDIPTLDIPRAPRRERVRVRTVWISDVHLGTRACKAEYLLDFLNHVECEQLYLIGDMIDFWNLKGGW